MFTTRDDDHGRLLPVLGQRGEQPRLAHRTPRAKRLVPQLDLVELEIHRVRAASFNPGTMADPRFRRYLVLATQTGGVIGITL